MLRILPLVVMGLLVPAVPSQAPGRASETDVLQKLLRQYDKNKDGKIQRDEYPRTAEAFANLDRDKNGVIDAADYAMPATRPSRDLLPDLKGEKLPKVGDLAPDFELPVLGTKDKKDKGADKDTDKGTDKGTGKDSGKDKDRTVKLSSFRGDRPVALVFGSYT